MGPREMRALRLGHGDRMRRWARIQDQWDLAHHNLYRATKRATRSTQQLHDAVERLPPEDDDGGPS